MGRKVGGRGGRWARLALLSVLSLGVVAGGLFMERRTLQTSVDDRVAKASGLAERSVLPLVEDLNLTKPLGSGSLATVIPQLEKAALGDGVVRVRIFAKDGTLVLSTDAADHPGSTKDADSGALRAAAAGTTTSVVSDDQVSPQGQAPRSIGLLLAYVPLTEKGGEPIAVTEIAIGYRSLVDASKTPWQIVELGGGFLAILFLEIALFSLARSTASRRRADRSGFKAAPGVAPVKGDAAGSTNPKEAEQRAKAAERDAQARRALEDQLSTLRTQMKQQQDESARAVRELTDQLKAVTEKATEAERRVGDPEAEQRAKAAVQRASLLEQRLMNAEQLLQEAQARAADLEGRVAGAERAVREADAARAAAEAAAEAEQGVPAPEVPADDSGGSPHVDLQPDPVHVALEREVESLRAQQDGSPSDALGAAAVSLYPLVASGALRGSEVAEVLVDVSTERGLAPEEARRIIASAFMARKTA
jgi:hypothetical protein